MCYNVKMNRKRKQTTRRSGLEDSFEKDLIERGIAYGYESETLSYKYTVPAVEKTERYTPDFPIVTRSGKKIYIETKGRLTAENRKKYLRVKNLLGIDLRFVFQKPNNKIYKGSKTTYWQWCESNGFLWAKSTLPDEWLME
jgi:hypothetical protein